MEVFPVFPFTVHGMMSDLLTGVQMEFGVYLEPIALVCSVQRLEVNFFVQHRFFEDKVDWSFALIEIEIIRNNFLKIDNLNLR